MKVMRKIMSAVVRFWNLPFVKYAVITVIGVVLVGFVGENSLLAHLRNKYYIGSLADEIEARERYFMKHDDEDIYVLSDDIREFQSIANDDETTE